jgi:hypothetical protein
MWQQQEGKGLRLAGREFIVDIERERVQPGWVPRRYGGGLGGRKESGQLRFGGRVRPFKQPITPGARSLHRNRQDSSSGSDRFLSR